MEKLYLPKNKGGDHMGGMDNEPKNAEEATAMHKELTAQELSLIHI